MDNLYGGYIAIADEIKPDAAKAISDLKKLGVEKTVMLTGDNNPIESQGKRILTWTQNMLHLNPICKSLENSYKGFSASDLNPWVISIGGAAVNSLVSKNPGLHNNSALQLRGVESNSLESQERLAQFLTRLEAIRQEQNQLLQEASAILAQQFNAEWERVARSPLW